MKKTLIIFHLLYFITVFANAQIIKNDWENPEMPSFNTVKPHAFFIPFDSEAASIKNGHSPFVQSLDGVWKFNIVSTVSERPLDFFKNNFDVSQWKNIKVPANWQTEGFDKYIFTDVEYPIPPNPPYVPKDFNPVGSYKRDFTIPDGWKGKDVFIRFGAVNSFFYLWINGQYIGFSKDSKTPAEFEITKYLKNGQNTVSAQVFRFSDGTYLEGQDMWKLSGIERSVNLIARPKLSVYDFFVKTGLADEYKNGVFDLSVTLNKKPASGDVKQSLEVKIIDGVSGKEVFVKKSLFSGNRDLKFHTIINSVKSWNVENPNLYTLIINQSNAKGKIIESISHKIGFRSVEIKRGLFLINGVAVKIKGTNRHEHDMYNAKVISKEGMINDIRMMKRFNINAVRTSHYPNNEEWYRLCDQYGIYVIDEVNLECDGMSFSPLNTLSDKPEWKAAYLDRTSRMFERDKNFCSIITWSLGNESRFGDNFIATYNYLKSKDDTRPVQYEEVGKNPYSDIYCPMYKSLNVMQEYVKEWREKPMIQCEYAHMMGNSGGNLKDDWDLIYQHEQLQGGFIWDFSDQTFKIKDTNGRFIWGYGRDMGNVGATSDTSFCADGLFAGDRSPHPQAFELKKVYQNIHFEPVEFSADKIKITNRFDFTNLKNYTFNWFIKADGKIVAQGQMDEIDLASHQSKIIKLNIPALNIQPETEYFLTIEARTKNANNLIPEDYIIATEQFKLPYYKKSETIATLAAYPALHLSDEKDKAIISTNAFSVSFNKKTGWLDNYTLQNSSIIQQPLEPHFWRAATDNDIGNSAQMRCEVWQQALKNARLDSMQVIQKDSLHILINTFHFLPEIKAHYLVKYIIAANGDVNVNTKMLAGENDLPEMPRFGMKMILNKEFDNVKWLGRGPFDNYWDRKYAAAIGVYQMPADSLFHPYARAQESGYRTDVRWIGLLNKEGLGLMAVGAPTISSGVLHFNMDRLDFDRDAPVNNHGGSMNNDDLIWWNIDYKQMGVGGDNAWGAKTHSEYMLPYRNYEYSFTLRPVNITDNIIEKAK